MNLSNKWNHTDLARQLESKTATGQVDAIDLDLSVSTVNNIHILMNNYTLLGGRRVASLIAASLITHAPGKALLRLERFLESSHTSLTSIEFSPELDIALGRIFASSGALSGRLTADLSIVRALSELGDIFKPHLDRAYYLDRYRHRFSETDNIVEQKKILHREHTVQLIRICARNAEKGIDISEINAELSCLAGTIIETCLSLAYGEMRERLQCDIPPHSLVVLGMGKLGGYELNVSSDIDLIYLYGSEERQYGRHDSHRFHTALAELLTRIMNEPTELGFLYRVDTRLRADGSSGPLVRSVQDYFRYLEMRGEAWERQMLLKARPVAGDIGTGESFLSSLERFIFPAHISRSPNREIVEIKNRIESRLNAEGSKKTHLKLIPGGIRDIEFISQCLQLLMGGIHPDVRSTGTIPSLDKLKEFNALSDEEYGTLKEAYILYRKVENALQWRELLPAFTLPEQLDDIEELAAYLSYEHGEIKAAAALSADIGKHLKSVRKVYSAVFSVHEESTFEEMALFAVHHSPDDDKVRRFLESLGFRNPVESGRTLSRLVFGEKSIDSDTTIHESSKRFLPKLLKHISELPDPGEAIERFARVTASYKARHMLFDVLDTNPTFLEFLLSITHNSLFITEILTADPSLLDWLVEVGELRHPFDTDELKREMKLIEKEAVTDNDFTQTVFTLKNREKLRIGARDITGLASTKETFSGLSVIADIVINTVLARARKTVRYTGIIPKDYSFSVIAAGRLGAGMMDFGSDLDLIFVYKPPVESSRDFDAQEYSIKLAQRILSLVTGGGGAYKIYDVDARLRPEGGNAVLAVSIDEYRRYLDNRASVWERLALSRSRAIAGEKRFCDDVVTMLDAFVYRAPFTSSEIQAVIDIRAAMISSSAKRYSDRVNVKSGAGGLVDIDFIAQTYAAHFGSGDTTLRHRDTTEILSALGNADVIERHETQSLTELYSFLCDVEKSLRIGTGVSVNALPRSESERARIARLLGFKNIRRFRKKLDDVISLTKDHYHRLMNDLLNV